MRFWLACTLAWLALPACAANLSVLPVIVNLSPGHDRETVTISNKSNEPIIIQAETVSWTQENSEDRYQPTKLLLLNPPIFSVPPGGSQILRIGLRTPADPTRETAYRLLLREVPPARQTPPTPSLEGGDVKVLLQLRLPVYVAPAKVTRGSEWGALRNSDGSITIELFNTGNVHTLVTGLEIRSPAAEKDSFPLAAIKSQSPIFPSQRKTWQLKSGTAIPKKILLDASTDQGIQRVVIDVAEH